jgi:hypothetical protein
MSEKAGLNLMEIVMLGLDGHETENKATSYFSNEKKKLWTKLMSFSSSVCKQNES